jgi:hypothetical protein
MALRYDAAALPDKRFRLRNPYNQAGACASEASCASEPATQAVCRNFELRKGGEHTDTAF